ncbi:MAG: TatD family hydrolase [Selenomonadaceae bacterium]
MMLVDTHAHIDAEQFDADRAAMIQRAITQGVTRIVNMGDDIESSARSVKLAEDYREIYAGVGIHPEKADKMLKSHDDLLAAWTQLPKVVAIGEIGLDYYYEKDAEKRELQKRVFIRQLDIARQMHMPVCVHNRDAHGDTLDILKREGKGILGVVHCFSGSWEMAKKLLRCGWYIGIDGPITFKNAAKLPEIIRQVPLDRLLVETDSPYLAPVPKRGKRNEPAFVYYVAKKAAELRGEDFETFAAVTTTNARHLYGIV